VSDNIEQDARMAVRAAVKAGVLPPASACFCADCGAQAAQYHHWNGYAPEHWLEVRALCFKCHGRAHRATRSMTIRARALLATPPPPPLSGRYAPPVLPSVNGIVPADWMPGSDSRMAIAEAAQRFGVNSDRLKRAAGRGLLPAEKVGRGRTCAYVVKFEDVCAYLATVRRGPKKKASPQTP
jgi:hypothetical protein